jgi:hypothetical protein
MDCRARKGPEQAAEASEKLPDSEGSQAFDPDVAGRIRGSFQDTVGKVFFKPIGPGFGPFAIIKDYEDAARELAQARIAPAAVQLTNILNKELK